MYDSQGSGDRGRTVGGQWCQEPVRAVGEALAGIPAKGYLHRWRTLPSDDGQPAAVSIVVGICWRLLGVSPGSGDQAAASGSNVGNVSGARRRRSIASWVSHDMR